MKLLWQPHTNITRFAGVQAEVWKILEEGSNAYDESSGAEHLGILQ
jgi:hypothetical protein